MSLEHGGGSSTGSNGVHDGELGIGDDFLRDILNKDLAGLEAGLDVLQKAVEKTSSKLKEKEDELVSVVQSGDSQSFALSFHQFAQNLAVSQQILTSLGLDGSSDVLALNKLVIASSANEPPLRSYASKAVLTSIPETWDEFVRKRHAQLEGKDDSEDVFNMPLPPLSMQTMHTHLVARMNFVGQKVLVFLKEDIELLDQIFREVGPLPTLVKTLYHQYYTQQISHVLSHPYSVPSAPSTPTFSRSPSISLTTPPNPSHYILDWDTWVALCLDVKKDVSIFSREAAKICGIHSTSEFEQYFPLLPVFHEISHTANELLAGKISRTFGNALAQERETFNQHRSYPSSHVPSRSNFQSYTPIALSLIKRRDIQVSPSIALSVSNIIRELDSIADFIATMEFRPLIEVFMRSLLAPMTSLTNRLSLAARDVPHSTDLEFLCINISTNSACALHERLVIYEHILTPALGHYNFFAAANSPAPQLQAPPQKPTDLNASPTLKGRNILMPPRLAHAVAPSSPGSSSTSTAAPSPLANLWEAQKMFDGVLYRQSEQIVSVMVDICSTYFFPNIDSNEWQDHRGFYFDARPSHGVQMLQYYLRAQSRNLYHYLLPHCVQMVVAHATHRCAEVLLARYQVISPSRMRSIHYRLDITYLVASIQTLQSACGAWYNKLGLGNMCGTLLGMMAIVVGPLETLCSFLQRYSKQKQKAFILPLPTSLVQQRPSTAENALPNFAAEFFRGAEDPLRADVLPLEDMQFLVNRHQELSSYPFNYEHILDVFCAEFSRPFLVQLVTNRPELKDNIYPPLSDSDRQLLPTVQDFLRPP